jgi:hypothetical protein
MSTYSLSALLRKWSKDELSLDQARPMGPVICCSTCSPLHNV